MFELSIEEVVYSHSVDISIKTQGELITIRAKYVFYDDFVCIMDSKHRIESIYVPVMDNNLEEKEILRNFLFDWIISDEGTSFMRAVFESKPPKI
jgi:hypothetical protein